MVGNPRHGSFPVNRNRSPRQHKTPPKSGACCSAQLVAAAMHPEHWLYRCTPWTRRFRVERRNTKRGRGRAGPMSPLSSAFSAPFSALAILISRLRAATQEPFCWRPTLCYRRAPTTESERCFSSNSAALYDTTGARRQDGPAGCVGCCGTSTEDPSRPRLGMRWIRLGRSTLKVLVSGQIGRLRTLRHRHGSRRPRNPCGRDRQFGGLLLGHLTTLVRMAAATRTASVAGRRRGLPEGRDGHARGHLLECVGPPHKSTVRPSGLHDLHVTRDVVSHLLRQLISLAVAFPRTGVRLDRSPRPSPSPVLQAPRPRANAPWS
jgi:hypothetical protein